MLKLKSNMEDLDVAKRQKVSLFESVDALKEGLVNKTCTADKNKDIS